MSGSRNDPHPQGGRRETLSSTSAVLHVLTSDRRRGAEIFGHGLAATLPGRQHVIALENSSGDSRLDVQVASGPLPQRLLQVRALARQHDVLLAHGSKALWAGAAAGALGGTPWVYRSIGDPAHWLNTASRRARVRAALRSSAALVALWPQAAQRWAGLLGRYAPQIEIIPNATARLVPYDEMLQERLAAWRRTHPGPVIAVVASLTVEKRLSDTILAVAALPDATLLLAGDGPEAPGLSALAAERLSGRVLALGRVEDVGAVLQHADLLLLTSETEGQPGCVLEAAAVGVPAVCTDVGGLHSLIIDGQHGRLVPLGDVPAIAAALRDVVENRGQYGSAAQHRWEREFSLDAVSERYADLLARVASSR